MKKSLLFFPLALLMACGSPQNTGSPEGISKLKNELLPVQKAVTEYRIAFDAANLRMNNWANVVVEIQDKDDQKTFVNTGYPALRAKMEKSVASWGEDWRGDGKRILLSSDSLVNNYKSVMGLLDGIEAYTDPEIALPARAMVLDSTGAVKSWQIRLNSQLDKLSEKMDKAINTELDNLSGAKK